MKIIELWDFQQKAVAMTWPHLHNHKKVLVVSPGGSGKTVMIAQQAREALEAGSSRVVIVSHRKEIIDQTRLTLAKIGLPPSSVGLLMGGISENLDAPIVVASIMTLIRRKHPLLADDVIVDEAHHALAPGYEGVLKRYPNARHTGYTATPIRMDGRGLRDFYDEMIVAALPSALIERQHLSEPIIYRAPEDFMPTLEGLKIARGDYVLNDLGDRVTKRGLVGNIVTNYQKHAAGKRAICFAVGIEHSNLIVKHFVEAGIPAAHVDGLMPTEEREKILKGFHDGTTLVISNCMVLSEGYDLPACDAVIMARPTSSLPLYIQQAARAMRYLLGKKPILLDHARLLEAFGLPQADRPYVLTKTKENTKLWNSGPVKDCPSCGACIAAGLKHCPNCNADFPELERKPPSESSHLLVPYMEQERVDLEQKILKRYGEGPDSDRMIAAWVNFRTKLRPKHVPPEPDNKP